MIRKKDEGGGHRARTELAIQNNDQSIRRLIDELVSGTRELKELYTGEPQHDNEPGKADQ